MKNLIVLAVAALFATNAVAAEMKWNGSAGWRYSQTSHDDNLNSKSTIAGTQYDTSTQKTRAHQMRANLGVAGGWENMEYGFGLRTGGSTTVNDDFVTLQNNADRNIGVEQAWFRYTRDFGTLDLAATIGRQKFALATDTQWETLFDNDVRWDGFGWNFKFGMFGINAAQYILGTSTSSTDAGAAALSASSYSYTEASNVAANRSKFAVLYAFQPYMNWKFSDEIDAMFAVAYYRWNVNGLTNATGGGVSAAGWNTGGTPAIANGNLRMDSRSQWDFLANISLPYNLMFTGNYVKANKVAYNNLTVTGYTGNIATDVSNSAWTLGLVYGKLRKAQDFTVGYAYGTKGIGSMMSAYTNDKFVADNKGHTLMAGYAMADNFHLGFRWMNLQEKERVAVNGTANLAGRPYQGAGNLNGNQKLATKYWELTAGVAF